MRFKKISPTLWAWISHLADSNLTVTKDGLQINGDITIPWEEIYEARALVERITVTKGEIISFVEPPVSPIANPKPTSTEREGDTLRGYTNSEDDNPLSQVTYETKWPVPQMSEERKAESMLLPDPAPMEPEDTIPLTHQEFDNQIEAQRALLNKLVPGWRSIVGTVGIAGLEPETEFRAWLAAQPAEYRHKINNTNNALEISASIKSFQAAYAGVVPTTDNADKDDELPEYVVRQMKDIADLKRQIAITVMSLNVGKD